MRTTSERRLGLTKFQPTEHLLKSLPAPSTSASTSTSTSTSIPAAGKMAPKSKTKTQSKFKMPPAFDAPPLSTSDEDESSGDEAAQKAGQKSPDPVLDSSEDELSTRGDIRATRFESKGTTTQARKRTSLRGQQLGKETAKGSPATSSSRGKRKMGEGEDRDEDELNQGSKPSSASTNPHTDRLGFTRRLNSKSKYGGRKSTKAPGAEDDIQDDDEGDKDDDDRLIKSGVRAADFIVPSDIDFLDSPPPKGGGKQFKAPDRYLSGDEDSNLKKKPKLRKPQPFIRAPKRDAIGSSRKAVDADNLLESSPMPAKKKFIVPASFSQFRAAAADLDPSRPLPTFTDDSDSLSDVPSNISTPSIQDLLEIDALLSLPPKAPPKVPTPTPSVCPWCQAPVDKGLLQDFSKGKRLNIRMQSTFCRLHKRQTALETWKAKKYPEIDWHTLESRFAQHRELLAGIISGDASHYRAKLANRIEAGQARSMEREEDLSPGYYGPRGFNIMCDYLVGAFGGLLQAKAVGDRVIAARGSAVFIQAVLVAELAVQLIREDMGVSMDAAREIMEESKALGELVHEDL